MQKYILSALCAISVGTLLWSPLFLTLVLLALLFLALWGISYYLKLKFNLPLESVPLLFLLMFYLATALTSVDSLRALSSGDFYNLQAQAFSQGRLDLGLTPDPALLELPDPYDPMSRGQAYYPYDGSYYKGKFYIYFGPAPVLFYFLPWRLLTGNPAPEALGLLLFCSLALIFLFLVAKELFREELRQLERNFFDLEVWMFWLLLGLVPAWWWLLRRPAFYEIAIASAGMFLLLSLWALLKGQKSLRPGPWFLLAGLAQGLVLASRPSLILYGALSLFFILRGEQRRSKFLGFSISFGTVAVLVALFNWARFDNPLDFGVRHQLNGMQMLNPVFSFNDLMAGLGSFLLAPIHYVKEFPYLMVPDHNVVGSYLHSRIHEPCPGLFRILPFAAFILFLPLWRNHFHGLNRRVMLTMVLVSGLLLFLDTQAGVTGRYQVDWLPMLSLVSFTLWLGWLSRTPRVAYGAVPLRIVTHHGLFWLTLMTCLLLSVTGAENRMQKTWPALFEFLKWLS